MSWRVSYDGDTTAELAVGDRFVISRAANHTKICKLHQRSFLEILRKRWEIIHNTDKDCYNE